MKTVVVKKLDKAPPLLRQRGSARVGPFLGTIFLHTRGAKKTKQMDITSISLNAGTLTIIAEETLQAPMEAVEFTNFSVYGNDHNPLTTHHAFINPFSFGYSAIGTRLHVKISLQVLSP